KQMIDDNRNFVIIFPELPWSAGDEGGVRHVDSQYALVWNSQDSDLGKLNDEVIGIIGQLSGVQQIPSGRISMIGHSAGGSALRRAASYGDMAEIGVDRVVFSDADYGSQTESVWNSYVKDNPNVELNLLISYPVRFGYMPDPYDNTKSFIENELGITDFDPAVAQSFDPNINYLPLDMYHEDIGTMSISWQSGNVVGTYVTNRGSGAVIQVYAQSCKYQDTCEELDKVWGLISGAISSSNSEKYWGFGPEGGAWKTWDELYGQIEYSPTTSSVTGPSPPTSFDLSAVPESLDCDYLRAGRAYETQEAVERRFVSLEGLDGITCGSGVACYGTSDLRSALEAVGKEVATQGKNIYVSYAYRNLYGQYYFWEGCSDSNQYHNSDLVCDPTGSDPYTSCPHLSGSAVDIQLRDSSGKQLPREELYNFMYSKGWVRYTGETWHFEYGSTSWFEFKDNCEISDNPYEYSRYTSREGYCDVVKGIN
ncbi:MAG: hypothetical protein KJ896_00480, partial [Nanoarchaeota archaeon]|nr:hypothetical protein [Nanoarchaeota archaeon]